MRKNNYSVKEIAEMSGVSVATVSRVINKNGRFSKETEDRVNEVIRKTNYQPNQLARGLRTSKTKTIGILVPDITNEFFARITLELQNRFFAEGYISLVFNTNEDKKLEQLQLNAFQSQQVSGLVYVSGSIEAMPAFHVPIVFIDRQPVFSMENDVEYILIESDNYQGGLLATEELIKKGSRNIACVCFNEALSSHKDRIAGYRAALAAHSLPEGDITVVHSVNYAESRQKVSELFSRKPGIDGLFCTTDTLAIGAVKAVKEFGLNVPEQVKVVGYDDTSLSLYSTPPLTTVRQQVIEISRLATTVMIDMLEQRPVTKTHYRIPVELVIRGTT